MSSSVSLEYLQSVMGNGNIGFTSDGGMFIYLINVTGLLSVRGTIVSASLLLIMLNELLQQTMIKHLELLLMIMFL